MQNIQTLSDLQLHPFLEIASQMFHSCMRGSGNLGLLSHFGYTNVVCLSAFQAVMLLKVKKYLQDKTIMTVRGSAFTHDAVCMLNGFS